MKIENQIKPLKVELENLITEAAPAIENYIEELRKASLIVSEFEKHWDGAWGSSRFNQYSGFPYNTKDPVVVSNDDIYEYIKNKTSVNLDEIRSEIPKLLEKHVAFRDRLITELSLIRGNEGLESENELLISIEKQSWGFSIGDYIKMRRPKSIFTYRPEEILNKGLDTPPHIAVGGDVVALTSELAAMRDFEKNAKRLLRQLELKFTDDEYSAVPSSDFIIKLCNKFHVVSRQILNRHAGRSTLEINDEYDVQDLFHGMLKLEYDDVRAEEYTPSYAGSSTRMDFLLKKEKIVIELKKTRDSLRDREIGDQLIIDVQHYKAHPDCNRLICFIYDPENKIKNPRGLEADLNSLSSDQLTVEVYIRP